MHQLVFLPTFAEWQKAARRALQAGWHWRDVIWQEWANEQPLLDLGDSSEARAADDESDVTFRVPREFLESAVRVACHRDESRWGLLYRVLWRLTHGERHLLSVATDNDVIEWRIKDKAVRHEVHKMRAFVRFRAVEHGGEKWFVAWFEPEHHVVELNAGFFVDRFASMAWSILTPERCMHWDGSHLSFTEGTTQGEAPTEDGVEALWLRYYSHIFNPGRVKVRAMQAEMPKRYWKNLPEAVVIPGLLRAAPTRVEEMVAKSRAKAAPVIVEEPARFEDRLEGWRNLQTQVRQCRACPLHCNATQAVFGEGPLDARILLLGEQPGDMEDLEGRPFVGPAGQLLDRALEEAGVTRDSLYVTNAVKHFKWEPRGKRRLHAKPNASEIGACQQWWQREVALVKPQVLVCLGATAAGVVCGRAVKVMSERGQLFSSEWAPQTLVTLHPSALLRMPDEAQREAAFRDLVADLRLAGQAAVDLEAASA